MIANESIRYTVKESCKSISKIDPRLYINIQFFIDQEEKKDELINAQDNLIYHLQNGSNYEVINRLKLKIETLKKIIEEF